MKKVEIAVGGKILKGFVEKIKNEVWVSINGKTFKQETNKKRRTKSTENQNSNEIIAPMPGKIVSVKMNVGDKIKSGDVVVMMEAMKMEYSLKSPREGKIKKMSIKNGDQVTLGQILVEIENV